MPDQNNQNTAGACPTCGEQNNVFCSDGWHLERPSAAPDEIVEAVALTLLNLRRRQLRLQEITTLDGLQDQIWRDQRRQAKAALTAAIPLIRAQVVAEIVAWLRGTAHGAPLTMARQLADAIEREDHLK